MASAPLDAVLSHWSALLEGIAASPLQFYASVEEAMRRREVPNVETSQIEWDETGVFSDKRVYLRVTRGRHVVDICAAPFGRGFFVSSWLAKAELAGGVVALIALGIGLPIAFLITIQIFGFLWGPVLFLFGSPFAFWVLAQTLTAEYPGWDDALVAMPVLGRFYERLFRPETYYTIDTALMFQEAVHNSLLEAVDQLTTQGGLRGLTELERKPLRRGF